MNISIIGDGGWGTALAILLSKKGLKVKLWGVFPEYVELLKEKRENIKFLPGIKIPLQVQITDDLHNILENQDLVVLAVPSPFLRKILKKINRYNIDKVNFLSVIKGIEHKTALRMSEVIREELGAIKLAVLSGPNIANEVAADIPSAAVCASNYQDLATKVQNIFMTSSFRVYTNTDLIGVELSGALKNIIAIACGISDGLGYGSNTKSALITRGLSEIARLGIMMGAKYETFNGLAGIGDLITTCFNKNSRNRWLGENLGAGKKIDDIIKQTEMVIEGVMTTKSAIKLAKYYNVEVPIITEVYNVLFKKKSPGIAVQSLMLRKKKEEV